MGREYLVFSRQLYEGDLVTGGCDFLSGATAGLYPSRVEPATLRAYFTAVAQGASRSFRLTYRDGKPLATGEVRRGNPTGRWLSYDLTGEIEQIVDFDGAGQATRVQTFGYEGMPIEGSSMPLLSDVRLSTDSTVARHYRERGLAFTEAEIWGITDVPGVAQIGTTRHHGPGYQTAGSYEIVVGDGEE